MQLQRQWRRWSLLVGALGGYIAWDIIDHTLLQPHGLGFSLDWGVVTLVSVTTLLVVERRSRGTYHGIIATPAMAPPAVVDEMHDALIALEDALQEANSAVSGMIGEAGFEEQRQLRRAMVALHQAQSLSEELNGLTARPNFQGPPPAHELFIH